VILEPPVSSWSDSLFELSDSTLVALRQQARKRLVDSAQQFVLRLSEAARRAGMLLDTQPLLTGDPLKMPIVMTGHQPVIFHSGLTFKYQATEDFAAQHKIIAVAVVIDTDEGDAGSFSIPACDASQQSPQNSTGCTIPRLVSRSASMAQTPGLYSGSRLKSAGLLSEEFATMESQLRGCHQDVAASAFRIVADEYMSLAKNSPHGFPTMEANLITRWNAGIGGRMLELPLSAICSFPEFIRFIAPILERPFEFAECYNQNLTSFRAEHRIRNEANPFPNLSIEHDWCELPFWVINHAEGTRHVLQVRRDSQGLSLECNRQRLVTLQQGNAAEALTALLFSGQQLVPRGALITATLRLLFSDLFIHGTGGGKYDPCTDGLIRSWWSVEPSPFAVASASRYLFAHERTELLALQQAESQLRDMQYNPQRFLGSGVFSAMLEEKLKALLNQKEAAVNQMKAARETGASAKDTGIEIQRLTDMIKVAVADEFAPRLTELRNLTEHNISAVASRTWPWFLFADQTM
jgi:hypothetical protein